MGVASDAARTLCDVYVASARLHVNFLSKIFLTASFSILEKPFLHESLNYIIPTPHHTPPPWPKEDDQWVTTLASRDGVHISRWAVSSLLEA